MKIAVISADALPSHPPGGYAGLEVIAFTLAEGLAALGQEVALFALSGSDRPVGCDLIKFDSVSDLGQYKELFAQADAITDHSWQKVIWSLRAENPEIKGIATHHGPHIGFNPPPLKKANLVGLTNFHAGMLQGEMGIPVRHCLSGETIVNTENGKRKLSEVVEQTSDRFIYASLGNKVRKAAILARHKLPCYTTFMVEVHTEREKLIVTPDHLFFTNQGWKPAIDLGIRDIVYSSRNILYGDAHGKMDKTRGSFSERELWEGKGKNNCLNFMSFSFIGSAQNRQNGNSSKKVCAISLEQRGRKAFEEIVSKCFPRGNLPKVSASPLENDKGKGPKLSYKKRLLRTRIILGSFNLGRNRLSCWANRWRRASFLNPSETLQSVQFYPDHRHRKFSARNSRFSCKSHRLERFPGSTPHLHERPSYSYKKTDLPLQVVGPQNPSSFANSRALSVSKEKASPTSNRILQSTNKQSPIGLFKESIGNQEGINDLKLTEERVKGITIIPAESFVYDLTTETSNFLANNVLVHNCYNGIALDYYPLSKKRRSNRLLYLNRLHPEKGAHYHIALARYVGLPLDLIGTENPMFCPPEYLEVILRRCDGKRLRLWGDPGQEMKVELIQKAKCLLWITPDFNEPFGMGIIEAMACGTPVIALNRGGITELVREGGVVINHWAEFRDALKKIEEITPEMCRANAESFSVEQMCSGYLRLLEEVADGGCW